MSDTAPPTRWTLRQLPLSAKITVAAFLISVGIGYISALVNLHFAEATPGNPLPTGDDVTASYHGKSKVSQLERLLVAHPSLPFNGQGSMRGAFTRHRAGKLHPKTLKRKASELKLDPNDPKVASEIWKDRDGERLALIAWVRAGGAKEAHESGLLLEGPLADVQITPGMVEERGDKRYAQINAIIQLRCVRCHSESVGGAGRNYPLDEFEDLQPYTVAEKSTGKSLAKLALTTHVHLLAFSILYGLTGLLLALTPLPAWIRLPLAPLPLIVQVADIACWWLARMEEPHGPMFAGMIRVTGAIVALGLVLQIVLTLISMFRARGWVVLAALFAAAAYGAYVVKTNIVDPHLEYEKAAMKETA